MPGRLITEFNEAGNLLAGDWIPIARGTTTLKLSAAQIVSKDTSGNINFGSGILTGFGAASEDCRIELGALRTASGNAYIDLHSNAGTDYSARLARWPGANGGLSLINTGTGNFDIWQTGAGNINLATSNTTRMSINSVGYVGIGTTAPERALHITGDDGVKSDIVLEAIQPPSYTGSAGPAFIFQHRGNASFAKTGDIISQISSRGYSTAAGQVGYHSAGEIQTIASGNFNASATRNADMTFATSHNGTFAEKLRIKSDGKVGIGTANPAATLDVQPGLLTLGRTDTNSEGGELRFCRAGDNAAVWSIDQLGLGTADSGSLRIFNTQTGAIRMLINKDGNIGVGTSSPASKMHVVGSGELLRISGSSGLYHGMIIQTSDASAIGDGGRLAFFDHQNENNVAVSSMHSWVYPNGSSDLYFHTTPTGARLSDRRVERMRLKADGKVHIPGSLGIGTDNPLTALDVRGLITIGPSQGIQTTVDNSNVYIAGGSYWNKGAVINLNGPNNTGSMVFSTGTGATNIERMRLDGNGNLGIGTNSPSSKLHVVGGIASTEELNISNTSNANQARFIHGSYGVIVRNDGTNFYLLPTRSGDQNGIWSELRPFYFNLANGSATLRERVFIGGSVDNTNPYKLNVTGDIYIDGWYRSKGNNGWYSETWGGGWHMTDSYWIRAYNNKSTWTDGVVGGNTGLTIGYNGATPMPGGASIRGNVGIGLGTQSQLTTSDVKLHVAGAGHLLRLTGNGSAFHGMAIQAGDASASANKTGFYDFQNENAIPVASMHSVIYTNGASDLLFHTTPAGARITDRRIERMKIDSAGKVIASGYRANQGVPNISDSSTNGYSFGDDGDTGLFSTSSGAGAGTVSIYANNQQIVTADTTKVQINKPVITNSTIVSEQEITIKNTASAGGQLRLIQGSYGVIARNDGTNFYLLATNSGDQNGIWKDPLRPFIFNLASGAATIGNSLTVNGGATVNGALSINGTTNISSGSVNITSGGLSVSGSVSVGGNVNFTGTIFGNGTQLTGNARGNRTVSPNPPSGGSDGDIWYQY